MVSSPSFWNLKAHESYSRIRSNPPGSNHGPGYEPDANSMPWPSHEAPTPGSLPCAQGIKCRGPSFPPTPPPKHAQFGAPQPQPASRTHIHQFVLRLALRYLHHSPPSPASIAFTTSAYRRYRPLILNPLVSGTIYRFQRSIPLFN